MRRIRKPEVRITPPNDKCKIRHWRKVGGGSLYLDNHILKPNEKFWAARESLPEGFLDSIIPIDNISEKDIKIEKNDLGYKLRSRGGGWFDIVDKEGKKFSQRAMRIDEANKMLADLS